MTTSRTSARSTSKAPRPVLHAKKSGHDDQSPTAEDALIMHSALSRISDSDDRHAMIERLAYQYAESRGFAPGHEVDDWLSAEAEVDARLIGERAS